MQLDSGLRAAISGKHTKKVAKQKSCITTTPAADTHWYTHMYLQDN
jgi:hypothetical protein